MASFIGDSFDQNTNFTSQTGLQNYIQNLYNTISQDNWKKDEDIISSYDIKCQDLTVEGDTTLKGKVDIINVNDVNISDRTVIIGKGNSVQNNMAVAFENAFFNPPRYSGLVFSPTNNTFELFGVTTQDLTGSEVNILHPSYTKGRLDLSTLSMDNNIIGYYGTSPQEIVTQIVNGGISYLASTDTGTNLGIAFGIGTKQPNKRLHVMNSAMIQPTTAIDDGSLILRNQSLSSFTDTRILFKNGVIANINNGHQASIVSGHISGGQTFIAFRTNNTSSSNVDVEAMRIAANGNVGIGVSNPNRHLHVMDSAMIQAVSATPTDGNLVLRNMTDANNTEVSILFRHGRINDINTSQQASIRSGHSSGGQTFITFNTNSNTNQNVDLERMRINHLGNVGIGTNAPAHKLHIQDGTMLLNNTGNVTASLAINCEGQPSSGISSLINLSGSGGRSRGIQFSSNSNSDNKWFFGQAYSGGSNVDNRFVLGYVNSSANVGVEVTASAVRQYTPHMVFSGSNNRMGVNVINPSATLDVGGDIISSGNIGIGTTTPTEKLHINNNNLNSVILVKSTNNTSEGNTSGLRLNSFGGLRASGIEWSNQGNNTQYFFGKGYGNPNHIQLNFSTSGSASYVLPLYNTVNVATFDGVNNRMGVGGVTTPSESLHVGENLKVNGNIYTEVGKMGLGTDNPIEKLDVNGNAVVRNILYCNDILNTARRDCATFGFPTVGVQAGSIIYDTATNILYCYNGTTWKACFT
jgi:hypothetical protein